MKESHGLAANALPYITRTTTVAIADADVRMIAPDQRVPERQSSTYGRVNPATSQSKFAFGVGACTSNSGTARATIRRA
jgi:hypothetical protein